MIFIFRYPRTKKIGFKTHRDTSFIDDLGKWKRVSFKSISKVTLPGKVVIDFALYQSIFDGILLVVIIKILKFYRL